MLFTVFTGALGLQVHSDFLITLYLRLPFSSSYCILQFNEYFCNR